MIKLYTLPGVAFNAPHLSVPLIKGYLKENNVETKQIDLAARFLKECINSSYIKNNDKKYYDNLDDNDKEIINTIETTISYLKDKKIDSYKIMDSNDKFIKYLNLYSNMYDVDWTRRGLQFKDRILSVDDVLSFAFKEENKLFDVVLESEKYNRGIYYLSVQFPFQLPYAIRMARLIKNGNNKSIVILGGDYLTHIIKNINELMEKCLYIDGIICFGENKYLLDLIEYFSGKRNYNIPNTFIRYDEKIINNKRGSCTKYKKNKYVPCFDDLELDYYISNLKLVTLTLNYGCYHSKCKFCSRYFYYSGYDVYDLDKIFNLIKELYFKEHIEAIYFIDECVLPNTLIKLANYLLDNNIDIKWMVETRIDKRYLDKSVSDLLYKSGCREISFGIESYNKKILKDMDKKIDLIVAKKVLKNFFESGITVASTFMIGYPTEKLFDIFKTLYFIKNFKYLDSFGLGIFHYMRNSMLTNDIKLDEEDDLNLMYRMVNDNYDLYNKIIDKFNLIPKIKRVVDIRSKILYRSQYLYLDREICSLNYRKNKEVSMIFNGIFKKKKSVKDLIYLKELKPEMTQCRVVQVDKKIKEKTK